MQINLNANLSNNQINFQSLKRVKGIDALEQLVGDGGDIIDMIYWQI